MPLSNEERFFRRNFVRASGLEGAEDSDARRASFNCSRSESVEDSTSIRNGAGEEFEGDEDVWKEGRALFSRLERIIGVVR